MGCAVMAKLLGGDREGLFAGAVMLSPMIEITGNLVPNAAAVAAAKGLRQLFPRLRLFWIKGRPENFYNDLELARVVEFYSV